MRFQVNRNQLAQGVAWAARHLSTNPTKPVLAGIRLEVTNDLQLKLSAFDYQTSAEATIPLDAGTPGVTLVSGRLLAEITKALPAQPVTFTLDGPKVVVTCGSTRFTLLTMPVEDYPSLPAMPPTAGRVGSDVFASAVAQVVVAAARDDTLPMLTGVRMEIDGDTITLAATDRYRLAVRELKWTPAQPDLQAVAVVPGRALFDLAKTITGAEVEIALSSGGTGEGMIGFSSAGRRTTVRLLDPDFPKFRQLFPTEFTATATIPTSAFAEAVKRVALVAERGTPIKLTFRGGQTFHGGQVVLEAGSGDEAQAVEVLPVDFEGDEITIAFKPTYLLDALGALGSDVAQLQFTAPAKPAVLTGTQVDYRHLIMPIRLAD